jgi:hypothetical protein
MLKLVKTSSIQEFNSPLRACSPSELQSHIGSSRTYLQSLYIMLESMKGLSYPKSEIKSFRLSITVYTTFHYALIEELGTRECDYE